MEPVEPSAGVPPCTVVVPAYPLAPVSVCLPPPIFVKARVPLPLLIAPPNVPDWSLPPTVRVETVPPLLRMVQVEPTPGVERPLIVSLKPLRFHVIVPVL